MTIPNELKVSENECYYEETSCVATKDPFVVMNEELHDLVLQHLDAEASEVCLSWCDLICYSRDCMKNFVVSLNSHFNKIGAEKQDEVVEIIKNTSRKYQNLKIDNCDEETTEKCLQLMKHFETNWISLKICWMKISDFIEIPDITLPNLEELELEIVPQDVYIKLLKDTKKLKKVLFQVGCSEEQRQHVINCLERNKDLKDLKLLAQIFACVFSEDVSKVFKFKLKTFIVSDAEKITKVVELNFTNFLKTQKECLEYISIGDMKAFIVNLLFREMQVLQTIYLGNITNLLELSLIENTSIITIKLPYLDDEESLQKILLASPNCEELYCKVITRQLIDFVILNMKHLKVLSSKNPIDQELIDYYERITDANVNKNIKMFVTEYW